MRGPTAPGDMWSGPGKPVYPAEVEEGTNWEAGRSWKDCGERWDNTESDGFTSVMSRILNKAAEVGEGDEEYWGKGGNGGDPGGETSSQQRLGGRQVGAGNQRGQRRGYLSFH